MGHFTKANSAINDWNLGQFKLCSLWRHYTADDIMLSSVWSLSTPPPHSQKKLSCALTKTLRNNKRKNAKFNQCCYQHATITEIHKRTCTQQTMHWPQTISFTTCMPFPFVRLHTRAAKCHSNKENSTPRLLNTPIRVNSIRAQYIRHEMAFSFRSGTGAQTMVWHVWAQIKANAQTHAEPGENSWLLCRDVLHTRRGRSPLRAEPQQLRICLAR